MFFQIPFFGVQLPDQRGLVHGSGFVAQNNSQNANCFCLLICCVLRIVLDGIFRVEETTMCHVSFDIWENLGYNRRVRITKGNKMLKIKIPFIDNSSHGYGKISLYDLKGFGIGLNSFSPFSFYNSDNCCVYLEEDCDLPKLIKLLKEKKTEVSFVDQYKPNFRPSEMVGFYNLDEVKVSV